MSSAAYDSIKSEFHFRRDFLSPYYKKGDPFQSLLARSTYLTKYCRDHETWTDTIRRVVEANISATVFIDEREAEMLFHLFWTGQALPPGRGLWTGGVQGIPADGRFNCFYTTLYGIDDWCWTANQLMLGGGVGVGLDHLSGFPSVQRGDPALLIWCNPLHPNVEEVMPNASVAGRVIPNEVTHGGFVVPDSRQGWVEALRKVLTAAFEAKSLVLDVSQIRPRGVPIRTFGGIACGPGPLVHLLRNAWMLVRGAQGRKLSSVEALDVTNFIGLCIKSGNVRRSAIITLGELTDQDFRDAKKDFEKVASHRHTSNNSIVFRSRAQIESFDWKHLVEDMSQFGEPGLINMPLIWRDDPGAKGTNPCSEIPLHDREACNLAEVFPSKFEENTNPDLAFRLVTRYCLRQRLQPVSDSQAQAVAEKNMRLGVGLGGVCDFNWTPMKLNHWHRECRDEANRYADELGVSRPIAVTTVKPSGTISLLNGSSPGMHAPYADFYVRRTRIAKNDPMAPAMMEAGVPYETDIYDQTGNTLVFSFPTKSRADITVQTETLRAQFERQAALQKHWADNSVSATISFENNEKDELAELLAAYVPHLKSTSCLPKSHGYKQPPYEQIELEEYERMYAVINHDHPLVHDGDIETMECSSGSCPVR